MQNPGKKKAACMDHIASGLGVSVGSQRKTYCGGAKRDRTADLLNAIQALSQLSYSPTRSVFIKKRGITYHAF